MAALIFVSNAMAVFPIFAVIGFTLANVFPIIFGMALQSRPDKANEISDLMITGVFGGSILPFFMELMSYFMGFQIGAVLVIMVSVAYMFYAAFAIQIRKYGEAI